MATIKSLGLHKPSALPYLITEAILPADASEDSFTWRCYTVENEDGAPIEEEILFTDACVVWSRGGVVKRSFRFDVENERVVEALFTHFENRKNIADDEDVSKDAQAAGGFVRTRAGGSTGADLPARSNGKKRKHVAIQTEKNLSGIPGLAVNGSVAESSLSRALVVILKSQIHIFFLSGDSHIVPLPFEVDSVWETPNGLLFQRKISEQSVMPVPSAPPNSFVSSQTLHPGLKASGSFTLSGGSISRPSLTISPSQPSKWSLRKEKDDSAPRVFSLLEPHSEMGLVAVSSSSRDDDSLKTSDALDPSEKILYVSSSSEIPLGNTRKRDANPLVLLVTLNSKTGMYSIWTARSRPKSSATARSQRRKSSSGVNSKRRSSYFDMTAGSATPVGRGHSSFRESFGGPSQGRSASNMSHTFNNNTSSFEYKTNEAEDLASQLGDEFGDVGASWKASRRVSSLLARSDLVASHDRTTFSDLAGGSQSKQSIYGGGRRGESFGGSNNRHSFGFHPRSSLPPGNTSVYSTNSSFLDPPVDKLLESLNNGGDFEGFESMGIGETMSGLPREVILSKVGSVPSGFSTTLDISEFRKTPKFEVFTLTSLYESSSKDPESIPMAVCILNRNSKNLKVITLQAQRLDGTVKTGQSSQGKKKRLGHMDGLQYAVRPLDVRHGSNVLDCCKLVDGSMSRMLVLSITTDGRGELTLQAPWSTLVKIELPPHMVLHQPCGISSTLAPWNHREEGLKRVLNTTSLNMYALDHPSNGGKVNVVDGHNRRHRVQIQMQPHDSLVRRMIDICRFVLRHSDKAGDGILIGWWEACKWLRARHEKEDDLEWIALVVIIFSMAVYFIEDKPSEPKVKARRKKRSLLRSSSGSHVDLVDWDNMIDEEAGFSGVASPWMKTAAWGWISEDNARGKDESLRHDQRSDGFKTTTQYNNPKNESILRCARLAREFLSSPQGEAASGSEGYLPTAVSRDPESRRTALGTILVGLHLLREEQKLTVVNADVSNSDRGFLGPVLAQLGGWLGWSSWTWKADGYYGVEVTEMESWLFEESQITNLDVPPEPFVPPSVFSFVENVVYQKHSPLLTIIDVISSNAPKPGHGRIWHQAVNLTPRTLALTGFLSEIKERPSVAERVALLLRWGITASVIDTLPDGISAPLHEAIINCQRDPPISWGSSLLELVDREDLFMSNTNDNFTLPISRPQPIHSTHEALRDVHHIGNSTLDSNTINSFDISAETDRQTVIKLIFRDDRRFTEAAKILNQTRAPVTECPSEPEWSESDLLEAQKELVQLVTLRTLSIPAGRAMLGFNARVPLLTEKLPIPSFSLQCIMKPSNVTISADRAAFTEEKVCWAFFHNGVSTGLALSRSAKGIDTSWILYNKPTELTNRHAGFLLALGLNGHLKSLAKWVAFKYLTPKHTMTSVGLLLGLSASYIGTMDPLITRLLSVHVTRMLPPGAAELNLSPLTQTTGVMGIGLLYCNSQHRRMSEVMLSEIENLDEEDDSLSQEPLRYEGYRLAAGAALGFVNLARGKDLRGLQDMRIVERLLALAVGTRDVDFVHILDKATAGATIALAIIFLKSNDESLARKIDIPDTIVQFDYVRPDIFLLRTLARHLIMWDSIKPNIEWVKKSLPEFYRRKHRLSDIRRLTIDDMAYYNIMAGLCFALGLRFAGSGSIEARDLLITYLDQFIRLCRLPALTYDGRLAQNSVRNCQDIVALSAAIVMAGTGDLMVFRRLRSLHGRVDGDTHYGSHMAAHMAIGMLFLGGGTYTLGTSDIAVASLLCSLYPVFPTSVLDNKCHLQAFRHLWVLAAEPRCLIPRDFNTRRALTIPMSLKFKTGETTKMTAPCLLPDLAQISTVRIQSPDHWSIALDFAGNEKLRNKFRHGDQSIYLQRRASYNAADSSAFSSTLMALSAAQDIPTSSSLPNYPRPLTFSATSPANLMYSQGKSPLQARAAPRQVWDWIFNLQSFKYLDMSEKAVVLPQIASHQSAKFISNGKGRNKVSLPSWLRPTVVDTRLVLDSTVRNLIAAAAGDGAGEDVIRDRLWQLRLLFAWSDSNTNDDETEQLPLHNRNNDDGNVVKQKWSWLRKDVIDDARWKIWGIQAGDQGVVGNA